MHPGPYIWKDWAEECSKCSKECHPLCRLAATAFCTRHAAIAICFLSGWTRSDWSQTDWRTSACWCGLVFAHIGFAQSHSHHSTCRAACPLPGQRISCILPQNAPEFLSPGFAPLSIHPPACTWMSLKLYSYTLYFIFLC